jgi:hypothetical protein
VTATVIPFDLEDASLGEGLSLIVVERDGGDFDESEIKVASDVRRFLESAWEQTLGELEDRELVPYSPEVVIRAGEGRALVINDDLRAENEVIDLLLEDADRAQVAPDEISAEDLYLYAVVSDTDAGRVAMIKKTNPTRRAHGGKWWALAGEELALMSDDPWQLHPAFDLVVTEDGGFALNTWFFEQLFADAERLKSEVGDWVDGVADALPMGGAQRKLLAERCRESARLRRRLRSIAYRGHLDRVSIDDVKRHLRQMGLPPKRFIQNGKLVVEDANIAELLHVLNEDLMRGGLTDDPFRVEAKEPM